MAKNKNTIKKRWHTHFGSGSIISGLIAILIAFIIYKFVKIEFFFASFENLVGLGIILIIAGLIFILFGKRIQK
jgi:hypothetical protein